MSDTAVTPTAPLWDAIWTAKLALDGAPKQCPYHGVDFGKAGMWQGQPRCDSCKQPFRVVRALNTIMALGGLP